MTIEYLIDFIDRQTNNGAIYPNKPETEETATIRSFSSRDWLALRSWNWQGKSDLWIEYLIYFLDRTSTREARQMIIHLALTGTEDIFFKAMEYIRNFRRDVDTYTWLKLQNRYTNILQKADKKSNNY